MCVGRELVVGMEGAPVSPPFCAPHFPVGAALLLFPLRVFALSHSLPFCPQPEALSLQRAGGPDTYLGPYGIPLMSQCPTHLVSLPTKGAFVLGCNGRWAVRCPWCSVLFPSFFSWVPLTHLGLGLRALPPAVHVGV